MSFDGRLDVAFRALFAERAGVLFVERGAFFAPVVFAGVDLVVDLERFACFTFFLGAERAAGLGDLFGALFAGVFERAALVFVGVVRFGVGGVFRDDRFDAAGALAFDRLVVFVALAGFLAG